MHNHTELVVSRTVDLESKIVDQDAAILAPLALAAFGSILDIASGMDDFCLGDADILAVSKSDWKYARFPNSFKTSLQQLVLEGYTAFSVAESSNKTIKEVSADIKKGLQEVVDTVLDCSAEEIKTHVNERIDIALTLVNKCIEASGKFGKAFGTLPGLAEELARACDEKVEHAEKVKAFFLTSLKIQLKELKEKKLEAHKFVSFTKGKLSESIHKFEQANEAYSKSSLAFCSQSASSGYGFGHVKRRAITHSEAEHTSISHHALLETVERFILLLGGAEGEADWDEIRIKDGYERSAAHGIHEHLKSQVEFFKHNHDEPAHNQLVKILEPLSSAAHDMVLIADGKIDEHQHELTVEKHRLVVLEALSKLKSTIHKYNRGLLVHETGRIATKGFHSSWSSSKSHHHESYESESLAKVKVKVEKASLELEHARTAYEEATRTVVRYHDEIIQLELERGRVMAWNGDLIALRPKLWDISIILRKLHERFSEISVFFKHNFASLKDAVHCYIHQWVETLCTVQIVGFAGVSTFDLTRQLIYQQLLFCLRLVTLAEHTANAYSEILYSLVTANHFVDKLFKVHFADVYLRKKLLFHLAEEVEKIWIRAPEIIQENRENFFIGLKTIIHNYEYDHRFNICYWVYSESETLELKYLIESLQSRLYIETVTRCDCKYEHHAHSSCGCGHASCDTCGHSKPHLELPVEILEVPYDGFSPLSASTNIGGYHSLDASSATYNDTAVSEHSDYKESDKHYSEKIEEVQNTYEEHAKESFRDDALSVQVV